MICHHCYFVKSCGCHDVEEDPIKIQSKCHKREASRGEDAGGQWWQQWHGTAGVGQHDEQPRPPVPERCSGSIQWRNLFGNAILWSRSCVDCHRILSFIHSCSMSLYMNSCKRKLHIIFNIVFVLRTWDPVPTIWHLHGEATGHLGFHTIYHTCSTKRIFLLMSISVGASQGRRPLKCH